MCGTAGSGYAYILTLAGNSKVGGPLYTPATKTEVLFVPHPHQHLALATFLILAVVGMHCMEFFMCIFLIRREVEYLFRSLLAI